MVLAAEIVDQVLLLNCSNSSDSTACCLRSSSHGTMMILSYHTGDISQNETETTVSVFLVCVSSLQQTFVSLFWAIFGQINVHEIGIKHPLPNGAIARSDNSFHGVKSNWGSGEGRVSECWGQTGACRVVHLGNNCTD